MHKCVCYFYAQESELKENDILERKTGSDTQEIEIQYSYYKLYRH